MGYQTRNLDVAAYLLAKGHQVIEVTGPEAQRTFHFEATEASAVAQTFYSGGMIQARLYAGALRDLKTLIHSIPQPDSRSVQSPISRGAK
jgi:hypothetical protein